MVFSFKRFHVHNSLPALKVGTDGVLLGALASLPAFENTRVTRVFFEHSWATPSRSSGCAQSGSETFRESRAATAPAQRSGAAKSPLGAQGVETAPAFEHSWVAHECSKVLDVGTGTGVVALMLTQRLADAGVPAEIIGIDIDGPAAESAARSFAESPWADSLKAVHASLAEFEQSWVAHECSTRGNFSMIVSNPPYFDNSLEGPDERRNLARHTESLSWREVIRFAVDFLAEDGRVVLIVPKQEETALLRFAASFGFAPARLISISTAPSKPPRRLIAEFVRQGALGESDQSADQIRQGATSESGQSGDPVRQGAAITKASQAPAPVRQGATSEPSQSADQIRQGTKPNPSRESVVIGDETYKNAVQAFYL